MPPPLLFLFYSHYKQEYKKDSDIFIENYFWLCLRYMLMFPMNTR